MRQITKLPPRCASCETSTSRRAAKWRAQRLSSTLKKLREEGFLTYRAMTDALNHYKVPTVRGGRWHPTSVARVLMRLGMTVTPGKRGGNGAMIVKRTADERAEALAPTIRELRAAGHASAKAIATELNRRVIPAPRGGKWHRTTVNRLLDRLDSQK